MVLLPCPIISPCTHEARSSMSTLGRTGPPSPRRLGLGHTGPHLARRYGLNRPPPRRVGLARTPPSPRRVGLGCTCLPPLLRIGLDRTGLRPAHRVGGGSGRVIVFVIFEVIWSASPRYPSPCTGGIPGLEYSLPVQRQARPGEVVDRCCCHSSSLSLRCCCPLSSLCCCCSSSCCCCSSCCSSSSCRCVSLWIRPSPSSPGGPPISWVPPHHPPSPIAPSCESKRPHPCGKGRGGCTCVFASEEPRQL